MNNIEFIRLMLEKIACERLKRRRVPAMGLIETDETNLFTFEPFASHDFYTEVNRALVRQALAHLKERQDEQLLTIVDMACGTGAVTRLIAEEMAAQGALARTRII